MGGAISVWRIRNAQVGTPQAAIGTGDLTLTGTANGPMCLLSYGVDTAGEVAFYGMSEVLVAGAGNVYATSFAAGLVSASGAVSIVPDHTPSHGCGVIAVPIAL